jgi:Fe-S-cluster containining protein
VNRVPLKVVQENPEPIECTECGKCCTYVGIEIDRPTRVRYVTDILWYLYHENVYIYVDGDNDWSLHFETRCKNLDDDLLCRVYEQRPHICREFDNETCEVNDHDNTNMVFRDPTVFLAWLKESKPKVYKKLKQKGFLPPSYEPVAAARKARERKRRKEA